jgi:hypothetical protein
MQHESNTESSPGGSPEVKSVRPKPSKSLPTDRLTREKQFHILRAVAKASLAADRGAVSNNDVSRYADTAASSVSLCNAFWVDVGLVIRDGVKVRPAEAVFEYDQAAEWTPDTAATKLAPILAASWCGKAMLTKLAIKSSSMNDALVFLAQECNASPEYKPQLTLALEYLQAAGLIVIDGTTVSKGARLDSNPPPPPPPPPPDLGDEKFTNGGGEVPKVAPKGTKRFAIPIPDKADAVIFLPEEMDGEDWEMVSEFLTKYVKRWKQFDSGNSSRQRVKINEE